MTGATHDSDMLAAAKASALVRLADGRHATLIFWPLPQAVRQPGRRSPGAKAKVRLTSGTHLSVLPGDVVEVVR